MGIEFEINGQPASFDGPADTPLLWLLREHFGLTGTKHGCGIAQCGACTVHVDARNRRSCVTPASDVAGRKVTTIEGATDPLATAVKRAWAAIDVPQCGYCQSGQIMAAIGLLREQPAPSDLDIDDGMAGNICRCASYVRIRQAIKNAAKGVRA